MNLYILTGALLLSFPLYGQGKDIYRWTDENGATHYADKIPEKFEGVARKVDTQVNELSTGRQDVLGGAPVISVRPAPVLSRNAEQAETMRPSESAGSSGTEGSEDCSTMRRKYWESQECFHRYRNVNGSVKAEAYQHCTVVKNPVAQCGPVITEP